MKAIHFFSILLLFLFSSCTSITDYVSSIDLKDINVNSNKNTSNKTVSPSTEQSSKIQLPLRQRFEDDGWDINLIDTARSSDYLSENEKDVFLATNALRSDPPKFADLYVKETLNQYSGTLLNYPNETSIQTKEGKKPVNELYNLLKTKKSMEILYPSRGMSCAASAHANDQSTNGKTSHTGSDGSNPSQRVNRYGSWDISLGENISYGSNNGLRIVLQLAIDDGVPSRGHRRNLLNENYTVSGVGISSHPVYGYSCTIDYAGEYTEIKQ